MKFELTKKQYKTLLTIMYCGEWVLNSHKIGADKLSKETVDLEQLIFSFAKEAGLGDWIEYYPDLEKYYPTADMEVKNHVYITKYNMRQKR